MTTRRFSAALALVSFVALCIYAIREASNKGARGSEEEIHLALNEIGNIGGRLKFNLPNTDNVTYPVTSHQMRVLSSAPRSIEVGLSKYRSFAMEAKSSFLEVVCVAGTQHQMNSIFGLAQHDNFNQEQRKTILLALQAVITRKLSVEPDWLDNLLLGNLEIGDAQRNIYLASKLVDYPGWRQISWTESREQFQQLWLDFVSWWRRNRSSLQSVAGDKVKFIRKD
jgi:hypothetical protein